MPLLHLSVFPLLAFPSVPRPPSFPPSALIPRSTQPLADRFHYSCPEAEVSECRFFLAFRQSSPERARNQKPRNDQHPALPLGRPLGNVGRCAIPSRLLGGDARARLLVRLLTLGEGWDLGSRCRPGQADVSVVACKVARVTRSES